MGGYMKKILVSLLVSLVLGGLISYFFLENQDKSYEISNYYGLEKKTVKEWDWDFITNTGTIVFLIAVLCFITWTVIEKRRDSS
jgi:ABC-type Fe3+-siderophore transport system permease subunit